MKLDKLFFGSLIAGMMLVFCGCDPDCVEFEVPTSALKAAMEGEIRHAKCAITFRSIDDDIKKKLPQIRNEIIPLLGKGGKIQTRDDSLLVSFVTKVAGVGTDTGKTGPLYIQVNEGVVTYRATPVFAEINNRLEKIDISLSTKDDPKQVAFRIVGDGTTLQVSAVAVFVDGKAHLKYTEEFKDDDEKELVFHRTPESVYSQIRPIFVIK